MGTWEYDVVNIACHEKTTIRALVQQMKDVTGSSSEIVVKDGIRVPFCLDDTRAVEMGYESILPLKMVMKFIEVRLGEK